MEGSTTGKRKAESQGREGDGTARAGFAAFPQLCDRELQGQFSRWSSQAVLRSHDHRMAQFECHRKLIDVLQGIARDAQNAVSMRRAPASCVLAPRMRKATTPLSSRMRARLCWRLSAVSANMGRGRDRTASRRRRALRILAQHRPTRRRRVARFVLTPVRYPAR